MTQFMASRRLRHGFLIGLIALSGGVFQSATAAEQPGLAQDVLSRPANPRPQNCYEGNTLELKLCVAADFREADRALNAAYKAARDAAADDKNRALLLEAQRSWLRFRDALCTWEGDGTGDNRGNTMSGVAILTCLARVTIQQTKALENALKP